MLVVIGNKKEELKKDGFQNLINGYENVVLDIGTGDGRFVYKKALENKTNFYVGMDPAEKQMEIYSKKANRKRLKNCLFIVGSVNNIPPELFSCINKIYINLPWGTLLENIAKGNVNFAEKVHNLLKKDGVLEIIFGYLPELEPSETKRLGLPDISEGENINQILSSFKKLFEIEEMRELSKKDIGNIETTWAKKLKHGRDRRIYKIILRKKS
ncbi:class I SAM-dependent methyltransferase [Patescibacteria group bacterium]|nr:class I SAM-dependent methyltransferase [Patescibacteria group bacterium]